MKQRTQGVLTCALLAISTLAVYWRVAHFEFVNLDDRDYVTANGVVTQGLTWKGVQWAFHTGYAANWHPLTWLSHMLDVQLFGLNAGAHHLSSLFFHIVNSLLLFLVINRMTAALWRSAFVAGLFALHPLHVESVAWIAERKDVLSTFFGLMSLWAYARYAQKVSSGRCQVERGARRVEGRVPEKTDPKSRIRNRASTFPRFTFHVSRITHHASAFYVLCLVFFACSLMCKPMLVTFPFLLLLLDYWPLRRVELKAGRPERKALFYLFWEKVPLLMLSALSSAVTLIAQHRGGTVASLESVSPGQRIAGAALAYVTYLRKAVWPRSLAMFYPLDRAWSLAAAIGAGLFLLTVSVIVLRSARRRPWCTVGWFWFLGTLIPVIGLVQVGAQAMADRYTYIPLVGLFIAIAWGVPDFAKQWPNRSTILGGLAAMSLVACGTTTFLQLPHWKSTERLCDHALRVTSRNFLAHGILGSAFLERGDTERAKVQFRLALGINPTYALALSELGKMLIQEGKDAEAVELCNQTLELFPQDAWAHYLMAKLLARQNQFEEAIRHFEEALRLNPNLSEAHYELVEARLKYAKAFMGLGKWDEAKGHLRAVVQAKPDHLEAHRVLAQVYAGQDQIRELRDEYREMLRLAPGWPEVLNNLAWLLATHPSADLRNGPEAVSLARRACELTGSTNGVFLATLAAAYAEARQFDAAIATQQKVCAMAAQGQDSCQSRLALYRSGKPYREP